MKRAYQFVLHVSLAALLSATPSSASPAQDDLDETDPVLDAVLGDVLVQAEPGDPGVTRITHICRVLKANHKAKKAGGASAEAVADCEGPALDQFNPWGYSWVGTNIKDLPCFLYPKDSKIARADLEVAIMNAFSVWVAEEAGEVADAPSDIRPPVMHITRQPVDYRPPSRKKDGKNVISFGALSGTTLAVTQIYISGTKILEFDMTFNRNFSWTTYPSAGAVDPLCGSLGSQFDVEHIAAHEAGHAYGLSHPTALDSNNLVTTAAADPRLTMYYAGGPGETHNRTLNTGDKRGIRSIY